MPKARSPAPPKGTKTNGGRLWRDVLGKYELEQHELALLSPACMFPPVWRWTACAGWRHTPCVGYVRGSAPVGGKPQRIISIQAPKSSSRYGRTWLVE